MVDLHGVIDKNPKVFKDLLNGIVKNQNKVYICSGARKTIVQQKLTNLGFRKDEHYHHILSLTDYFEKNLPECEIEYDHRGNIWVDDTIWSSQKGIFCKEYHINVIIDDTEEYFIYIPKNVLRMHIQ